MPNPKSLNKTNCDYLQPSQDYHQLNWRKRFLWIPLKLQTALKETCFFFSDLSTFMIFLCSLYVLLCEIIVFLCETICAAILSRTLCLGFHWLGTCTLYNKNEDESNLIDAFWLHVKKITWSGNVLPSPVMRSRCWVPCLTEGERVRSTKAFTPSLSTRLNQKLYCGCTGSAGNTSVRDSSERLSLVICSFTL